MVPAAPSGAWERVAGPGQVAAQRVVPGTVAGVEAALNDWMEDKELFCVQRRQPGRVTWEPLGGMAAAVRRSTAAFSRGAAAMMLARAETVSATVLALEAGWCHVALSAETRRARAGYVGGGAAVAGAGMASAGIMVVLGALLPVALLPIPVALGVGYGVARQYRPVLARIQLGLERALDQLEQRGPHADLPPPRRTPGLFGLLADEIRRSLR